MRKLVLVLLCLPAVVPCKARIITVDADGPADFNNIQAAIDDANDGDEVVVQPGSYEGEGNRDIDFLGKAIIVRSTEPNKTSSTLVNCNGIWLEGHRGFTFQSGEDSNSVLDGITIANGLAWNENGGGILCQNSNPTIRNCVIRNCAAEIHMFGGGNGGGIYCEECSPRILNCFILNNACSYGGGGIGISSGAPEVSNCTIEGNVAGTGGGIDCLGDSAVIIDCIIADNDVEGWGGGVCCREGSNALIRSCSIVGNSGMHQNTRGGGIACTDSSPRVINCLIGGSLVDYSGGGIYCADHSSPAISNCTIVKNHAGGIGPGVYGRGGGIYCYWSDPNISNSVLWGNTAETDGPQIALRAGSSWPSKLTVSFCDIQGGQAEAYVESGCTLEWETGNVDCDPCFADLLGGDYHFRSEAGRWNPSSQTWTTDAITSLCIEAGDPNSDWTAELWPHGKRINIGAYGGTPQASMSVSDVGNIADFDNDDDVDYADMGFFGAEWLSQEILLHEDLDRNGTVDACDFAVFGGNWRWEQ